MILDLLTVKFLLSYSTRPLQIFGLIGLVMGGARRARHGLAGLSAAVRVPVDREPAAAAVRHPADLHRRAARHARAAGRAAGAHLPRVAEQADLRDPRDPRNPRAAGRRARRQESLTGMVRSRRVRLVCAVGAAALIAGLWACGGESPTAPSSGPPTQPTPTPTPTPTPPLALTAPQPDLPSDNAQLSTLRPELRVTQRDG